MQPSDSGSRLRCVRPKYHLSRRTDDGAIAKQCATYRCCYPNIRCRGYGHCHGGLRGYSNWLVMAFPNHPIVLLAFDYTFVLTSFRALARKPHEHKVIGGATRAKRKYYLAAFAGTAIPRRLDNDCSSATTLGSTTPRVSANTFSANTFCISPLSC